MGIKVIIRRIHTYSGFVMMGALLMYVFTAYIMTHKGWFPREAPEPIVNSYQTEVDTTTSPEKLSIVFQNLYGLNGQARPPKTGKDGKITFSYSRPGTDYEAVWEPQTGQLEVTTKGSNFARTMERLHRVHGYGDNTTYNIYAFIVDLMAIAMLLFTITGVYMWINMLKHKWLGWSILAAGMLYTAWVIWAFVS